MSDPKENDSKPEALERRPYEKPAVVSEETFETLALACGPVADFCPGQSS